MKALTLWPEWAWAVCFLDKRVENRTWKPPASLIGQRIGIHAGARIAGKWEPFTLAAPSRARYLGILEAVRALVDPARAAGWQERSEEDGIRSFTRGDRTARLIPFEGGRDVIVTSALVATAVLTSADQKQRTGWDYPGAWHWRLADVVVLDPPRPMRGKQGLWELRQFSAESVHEVPNV